MLRFRACGISFSISFWFLAVIALFLLLGRAVFFLYILFPILIHELGHLTALKLYRGRVTAVRFEAFGIDIVKQISVGMPYRGEIIICTAGVFFNLLAASLLYLYAFQSVRVMLLIASNVAVAAFNLLPIGNLDGGTLIRLLGERFGGVRLGYHLSRAVSLLTLAPLFGFAFFLFMQDSPNVTLLVACLYLAGVVIRME